MQRMEDYDSVVAVVTDGGANMKYVVIEEFGTLKHIGCIAHTANNIRQASIGLHNY